MKDLENIIENLYDGIYYVDANRKITYWNRAAEKLTGFQRSEVLGRSCQDNILSHVNEEGALLCKNNCPLAQTLADGKMREADVYLHHRDGHRVPVSIRISPVRNVQGEIIGAIEIFNDVGATEFLRTRMRELEKLVLLDPLTKLANRRLVEISIRSRIEELKRYGWPSGLLFFDVDHFKRINDTYGHGVGDQVLTMLAGTLVSSSRPFDTYGRWGGEELVGVISNIDITALARVAEKLRSLIAGSFLTVESKNIQVTVSVGATMIRSDDTVDSAINRADQLMYQSKKNGRNRTTVDKC